ncbi:hypothetical protein [Streptomyces sp. VNUA74]|uniref:hypothetical protein n=1 Tax=Streptomyces sp. VNUA74 TaxID=3062685 RepID=UPI00280C2414|nr:hypothetical protein [Streptomyces sp. VNUA74]WML79176.1 hypothetical protein Q3101_04685 [Streptomyces sp. VNUA74]
MQALGRTFDISAGIISAAVNNSVDVTGKRVSLQDAGGVTIVVVAEAGTAGDDLDLDLKQHTAASGGLTADLDVIDHYYYKSAATLAGTETWTRATQTAASEIVDATGGAGTSAEQQQIVVIEVEAEQLSDGYAYVSLDATSAGTNNDKLATVLYFLRDLKVQRKPTNMRAPLS